MLYKNSNANEGECIGRFINTFYENLMLAQIHLSAKVKVNLWRKSLAWVVNIENLLSANMNNDEETSLYKLSQKLMSFGGNVSVLYRYRTESNPNKG